MHQLLDALGKPEMHQLLDQLSYKKPFITKSLNQTLKQILYSLSLSLSNL